MGPGPRGRGGSDSAAATAALARQACRPRAGRRPCLSAARRRDPEGEARARLAPRPPKLALGLRGVARLMSAYRQQALLDAPLEEVWPLVGTPARHPEWWPRVIEVRGERFEQGDEY